METLLQWKKYWFTQEHQNYKIKEAYNFWEFVSFYHLGWVYTISVIESKGSGVIYIITNHLEVFNC